MFDKLPRDSLSVVQRHLGAKDNLVLGSTCKEAQSLQADTAGYALDCLRLTLPQLPPPCQAAAPACLEALKRSMNTITSETKCRYVDLGVTCGDSTTFHPGKPCRLLVYPQRNNPNGNFHVYATPGEAPQIFAGSAESESEPHLLAGIPGSEDFLVAYARTQGSEASCIKRNVDGKFDTVIRWPADGWRTRVVHMEVSPDAKHLLLTNAHNLFSLYNLATGVKSLGFSEISDGYSRAIFPANFRELIFCRAIWASGNLILGIHSDDTWRESGMQLLSINAQDSTVAGEFHRSDKIRYINAAETSADGTKVALLYEFKNTVQVRRLDDLAVPLTIYNLITPGWRGVHWVGEDQFLLLTFEGDAASLNLRDGCKSRPTYPLAAADQICTSSTTLSPDHMHLLSRGLMGTRVYFLAEPNVLPSPEAMAP